MIGKRICMATLLVSVMVIFPLFSRNFAAADADIPSPGTFREGELLVKFRPYVTEQEKERIHKKHGSKKAKEFRELRLDRVVTAQELTTAKAIVLYRAEQGVEYAEPNYIVATQAMPNDPLFDRLWGMFNYGQTGGAAGADIGALRAWDMTTGAAGRDVVVAVIDSGIDYLHEDLSANVWANPGEVPGNGMDDDGNGYVDDVHGINAITGTGDPMDDHGHGTHVSGIIGAAGNNGLGVSGVNWNASILGCKFASSAGTGTVADAITCLEYIRALKARGLIIAATNNSWGGPSYSQALYDAVSAQEDILFVAGAGNFNWNIDSSIYVFYPAKFDLPHVIAVAATDHNDDMADFSNYGRRTVHVSAPGAHIVSLRAAGTDMYGDGLHFIPEADPAARYYLASGTSMAAPHVSGLAALLKAADPARTWKDIRNLLLAGGDIVSSLTASTVTGRRINAFGSLTCSGSPAFSVIKCPSSYAIGHPATVSALSIVCASPAGPVLAVASDGGAVDLRDDGVAPDPVAEDGVFTGAWTPATSTSTNLSISSSSGTETIPVNFFTITTGSLPNGILRTYYRTVIATTTGETPYTWSLVSGGLPPGLSLSSSAGVISGTPTALGSFSFTVKAVDRSATPATKPFTITVLRK